MSEHQYKQLFENIPLPLWVIEVASNRVLAQNEAASNQKVPDKGAIGVISYYLQFAQIPACLIILTDSSEQSRTKAKLMLANELHDNVSQILAAANLFIDMALSHPDENRELLRRGQENILLAISEIRKLSDNSGGEPMVTIS